MSVERQSSNEGGAFEEMIRVTTSLSKLQPIISALADHYRGSDGERAAEIGAQSQLIGGIDLMLKNGSSAQELLDQLPRYGDQIVTEECGIRDAVRRILQTKAEMEETNVGAVASPAVTPDLNLDDLEREAYREKIKKNIKDTTSLRGLLAVLKDSYASLDHGQIDAKWQSAYNALIELIRRRENETLPLSPEELNAFTRDLGLRDKIRELIIAGQW